MPFVLLADGVSIFAYATLAISAGVFGIMALWVIRPDGIPLLSLLSPRERGFRKARKLLAAGDWKAAFAVADSLRDPLNPDPTFDKKIQYFEGDCLYQAAEKALQNSHYTEALELMRGAGDRLGLPEAEFDNRIVELLLAEIRRRSASDPTSVELERLVAELKRVSLNQPEASFWLGLHFLHVKKYDSAVGALQEALANENVPDAALYLGALHMQAGQPREALRWLGQAARLANDNPYVQWQLGEALLESSSDPAAAVKALEKATGPSGFTQFVGDPKGLWASTLPAESWLAQLMRRTSLSYPIGMDQPEQALSLARRSLATALERCNRSTDAASVYYQAFSSGDDSPLIRRGLGLSLARSGLYDDALPHLKAAQSQEKPPTSLTTGYLAVCTARATSASPEEHAANLIKGIDVLTGLEVRGDVEWARLARELYREVETAGVKLSSEQIRELALILTSVSATDATAIEIYDLLVQEPDHVPPEVAALYVHAATERKHRGKNDLEIFDRAFRDRDGVRRYFVERKWDFTAAERLYLTLWVEKNPGRYPDAPGPIYAAVAERMLIDESRAAQANNKLDAARFLADLAARLGPTRALTLDRLAEMAYRRGDRAEALRLLNQWSTHHPNDQRPLVRRALIELQDNQVDTALELLAEACDKSSGVGRARLNLVTARVALTAKQTEIAEELLEQARASAPTDPEPLLALAALAWKRGDYDRVASFAIQLDRLRGDDPQRAYFTALAHTLASNESSAEAAFATAESSESLKTDVVQLRATLLAWQGREDDALRVLDSIPQASGSKSEPLNRLKGQLAWKAGDYSMAWKAWNALPAERRLEWRLDQAHAVATFVAGLREWEAGRAGEALNYFRQARTAGFDHPQLPALESIARQRTVLPPNDAEINATIQQLERFEQFSAEGRLPGHAAWLARAYRHRGAREHADALLTGVSEPDFHVTIQRGLLALDRGQLAQAETAFAEALAIDSSAPAAIHNLTFTRLSLGRLDELDELLGRAIDISPTPEAQRILGFLRASLPGHAVPAVLETMTPADEQRFLKRIQHLGQLEAAQNLLERALTARPDSPVFQQAKSDLLVLNTKQFIDRGQAEQALALPVGEASSRALSNLFGVAAALIDDHELASKHFQAALPMHGDDARVQQNLALTIARLGNRNQARTHWQKYLTAFAAHCPVPPKATDYLYRLGGHVRQRLVAETSP